MSTAGLNLMDALMKSIKNQNHIVVMSPKKMGFMIFFFPR